MAKTKGAKTVVKTPAELEALIEEYFEACAGEGVFADFAGMLLKIGMTKGQVAAVCEDGYPHADEYVGVFERAKYRRECLLTRKMASDNKAANGCMNLLKQKENGGYVDKSVEKAGPDVLKIQVIGGHGGELFK